MQVIVFLIMGILFSFGYWDGFPFLFSATRLGLLAWCFLGVINLFIKTDSTNISRVFKRIWFCLGLIVWPLAGYPVDFQQFPIVIVILGLILSWSWILFYIYAIIVRRAKPIVYVILIGILSAIYWFITPAGIGHMNGDVFREKGHNQYFASKVKVALTDFRADNNQNFPQIISEFSKYLGDIKDSFLSRFQMSNYVKSGTSRQFQPNVIIFYEKNISLQKKYYTHHRESPGWKTRPRGRFVVYADGEIEYLKEEEFQEKLKSLENEFGE